MVATRFLQLLSINLLLCLTVTFAERDFYKILGIERTAETKDIKRAYRKKAVNVHPDKNPSPQAEKEFADLTAAYEVLVDSNKRKSYDRCGEKCVKSDDGMDHHNPFASFFGDFGFHFDRDSENHQTPKGANVVMDIFVTLEELYSGDFVEVTRNKPVAKPAKGTRKCNCRQEMVTRNLGNGRFQMIQQNVCEECPNVQFVNEERLLEVEIEPGMIDGQTTTFSGEGEPHMDGDPGDFIVRIRTQPHPVFERIGDDLHTNITITLQDALVGFTMELKHLDGHKVTIQRDKVTKHGARMRKKGEGMPNYSDNNLHGNLYITFDIAFPDKDLTEQQKEDIKALLNQIAINRVYNGIRSK